jgi:hypothetical protein
MQQSAPSDVVRLTGKAALTIGLFVVGLSLMGAASHMLVRNAIEPRWPVLPGTGLNATPLYRYTLPIYIAQCAMGVCAFLAGIGLMRRDPRARAVLEAITWVALLWCVGGTVFAIKSLLPGLNHMPAAFGYAALGFGAAVGVGFAIGFGFALRHLRSARLRDALQENENGP